MPPTFHPAARDRPIKPCRLLASPHDGKRATAARKASDHLQECGLTSADVILPKPAAPAQQEAAR